MLKKPNINLFPKQTGKNSYNKLNITPIGHGHTSLCCSLTSLLFL